MRKYCEVSGPVINCCVTDHPEPCGFKESEVAQSCPTLCDPMDCSPPGSSIHGILQARILEWGAISFSRGVALGITSYYTDNF